MKLIGGEAELKENEMHYYLTDSGRSSLRLILRSAMKAKKYLLPDYLCRIILDIFDESGIAYEFYGVNRDLAINIDDLKGKSYDAIYLINYFGQKCRLEEYISEIKDKLVIEDYAFSPDFEKPAIINKWVGFNSFRKFSILPEGSNIKSSLKLDDSQIRKGVPPFVEMKYKAKAIKYEYLGKNSYSEDSYLDIFSRAEDALDKQKEIYSISSKGLVYLVEFYRNLEKEYHIRKENFKALDKHLKDKSVKISPEYYSFYVLDVDNRDELRRHLFSKRMFLPVHWPVIKGIKNELYERLLSVPVDSRYNRDDMKNIARVINDHTRRSRKPWKTE